MRAIPIGFCQCGCGGLAPIAKETRSNKGMKKGEPLRFISGHNIGKKEACPFWKGGRTTNASGYVEIKSPVHPKAGKRGYVYEHVLIAEKALGKFLPAKAAVHHHNLRQLVVCQDHAYHMLLHQRQRAYNACGHANWRKCRYCKQYDDPIRMSGNHRYYFHKNCRNVTETAARHAKLSKGGGELESHCR